MNVQMSYTVRSEAETERWAHDVGSRLKGGEVIELVGDLGSGKTTLTRGVVRGTGSIDHVSSPTFTISKQYNVPEKPARALRNIVHADLYRLPDPGLMAHELADTIGDPTVTLVVEWAEAAAHVLPAERLIIHLSTESEYERRIEAQCPDSLSYLLEKPS